MKKRKVYIVHGYMASPTDHWFPWLKQQLEQEQIEVNVLALPESSSPSPVRWLKFMQKHVELDEASTIVAHSLGCLASFNLMEVQGKEIEGLLLVAGFINESPLPELNHFVSTTTDAELIRKLARHRVAIAAKDDAIVPYEMTVEMSKKLDAELITLANGNHLMASDGFVAFPLVLDILKQWYANNNI